MPKRAPGRTYPWGYRVMRNVLRPLLLWKTERHWQGAEHLPSEGGFLAVGNHASNADPITFAHFLMDNAVPVKFMAKREVFESPVLATLLKSAGMIPVDRGTVRAADSLAEAKKALQRGECVGVFPEGTLSHDPDGWPMKPKTGVARLALETRLPVIPIGQWGAHRFIPFHKAKPASLKRQRVDVKAGPAVELSDLYGRESDPAAVLEAMDRIWGAVRGIVAELRGEELPERLYDPKVHGKHPEVILVDEKRAARKREKAAKAAQRAARRGKMRAACKRIFKRDAP